jgi:uncharacterized coiled-coil protein SlyX
MPETTRNTTTSDRAEARLVHLEEVEAHNARQLELLNEALLDLGNRLDAMGSRLGRLEAHVHRPSSTAPSVDPLGDEDEAARGDGPMHA